MPLTLEQLLAQVAQDHGLTSISVGRMPVDDRVVYTADVHWNGFSKRGITCESGSSDKSVAEALTNALNLSVIDRRPPVADLAEVPAFEVAA